MANDMAGGCNAAVMERLPKAALAFDHFHVVKLMNEKLGDLRREMYHELTDKLLRQVLKGHAVADGHTPREPQTKREGRRAGPVARG